MLKTYSLSVCESETVIKWFCYDLVTESNKALKNHKNMYEVKNKFVGIRISQADKKRLEEIAWSKRLTLSSFIRTTLSEKL